MQPQQAQTPMASSSLQWSHTLTRLLAAMCPLAATAGTPIPGKVESPQHSRPAQPRTVRQQDFQLKS